MIFDYNNEIKKKAMNIKIFIAFIVAKTGFEPVTFGL